MSNQDRLLSDEELMDEALAFVLNAQAKGGDWRTRVRSDLGSFINTQKRLYAESVLGADDTPTHPNQVIPYRIRKDQRNEQLGRIRTNPSMLLYPTYLPRRIHEDYPANTDEDALKAKISALDNIIQMAKDVSDEGFEFDYKQEIWNYRVFLEKQRARIK